MPSLGQCPDMAVEKQDLSPDELVDWLRLTRTEGVGPVSFFQLLERFRTAGAALQALPDLARHGGRKRVRIPTREESAEELEQVERADVCPIPFVDGRYPQRLLAIADPPPLLFVRGREELLAGDGIAIVGARNASAGGSRFARKLAREIGEHDLSIISGMARGIDAAAHSGAIESGTIAVLAGGVDMVYPPENHELYETIVDKGAVVSEMGMGTVATARHFPRRNRLISGLSLGVVVVEAAQRSGSLITARLAGEQGREVFAVPGSPLDPRARGTNALIRQGAQLTEGVDDVLEAVARMRDQRIREPARTYIADDGEPATPALDLTRERSRIKALLGPAPTEVDELIRQSELTAPEVITILLELDLAGRLDRHPGNRVSLR